MRQFRFASVAVAAICFGAYGSSVKAQAIIGSPIRFGIDAGLTLPRGSLSEFSTTGWNAGALMTISMPLAPLSFRLDGQWHQLPGIFYRGTDGEPDEQINVRTIVGTANAVYTFRSALPAKFYLIGGAGVYFSQRSASNFPQIDRSITSFGLNGGVGVKLQLPGLSTFIEARYHYLFHSEGLVSGQCYDCTGAIRIIPISVGILF